MGSQHLSPHVKTLCNFEPQIWPDMITSRDAESTCFKGSRTSCDVINFGHLFWPNFGQKRSRDGCFLLIRRAVFAVQCIVGCLKCVFWSRATVRLGLCKSQSLARLSFATRTQLTQSPQACCFPKSLPAP